MPRLLQFIAVLMCLLASQPLRAFSLLGPVQPFPGNEAWQTALLGYNPLNFDIGAPKNLGEEYRWNVPVITYAFDPSFLTYFGNEGVAAVDAAFGILNSLPDLTSLSTNLSEYPLLDPTTGASTTFRDSRRINLRAEADNLVDMKSVALGLIVEELGLASPERWTWAIRDRRVFANNTLTQYLTIQRNFDPVTTAPSKYVNGGRYTYEIVEFANPSFTDAIEATVDPEHRVHSYSSLANISGGFTGTGLEPGIFYTYLTRDDIGGLKYIYSANNLHWEPFPPNTQMFTLDTSGGFISLTNQDLTLLSLRSLTSAPDLLRSFYPGLVISEATPNPITIQSNIPIVVTQLVTLLFQTNFQNPQIVSNIDLFTFSSVSLTSAPPNLTANLQAAFPGVAGLDQLVVLSTNFSPTTVVQVASVILTNAPKQPWDDAFTTNFIFQTNFVTNIQILYHYTFRNVQTNYFSPTTVLRRVISGLEKEPWSTAVNPIFKTTTNDFLIARPSGAITIIPTNLVGFVNTPSSATNVFAVTNFVFSTNFVDPNTLLTRTVSQTDMTLFTNVLTFAYPIEFLANPVVTNIFVTNAFVTTNILTFKYAYANVLTNYAGPNTPATRVRFQITPDPNNPAFNQTNIVSLQPTVLDVPSGGFLIDTNLTGFQFTGPPLVTVQTVTNIVFDITDLNGLRTVEAVVYNFTNSIYFAFPFVLTNAPASVLRPGVSKLRFQRIGGTSFTGNGFAFTNRYTTSFYTNGFLTNAVFQVVQTQPDFLIRARDLGGLFSDSVLPVQYVRSPGFRNNALLNSTDPNQGGPGTIEGPITLDFNKLGPSLINEFPGFMTEASALEFGFRPFVWGLFDGSTNAPIVFPKSITLEDIELLTTGGAVP
jgi:hypothetical protein